MKIVLFIDSLTSGGAQRQMVILGNQLCECGHEVFVITYHPLDFYRSSLCDKINYLYVTEASNTLFRIPSIYRIFKQLEPEVIISYLDVPNIIACICKLMGLRYKLIVSERNTTQSLSWMERIKFYLYRMADVIVPNSYTQTKFIEKHYPHLKNKLKTITNCAETDFFVPNSSVSKEHNTVLCVGRVTAQKIIVRFIEAVAQARSVGLDITVKWFGRCDKEYYEKCKILITQSGLQEHFLFYDASQDVRTEYQRAEVFCLPSIFEGFPNVVGEAMCCGLPILCSNVCDNQILVKHGENGLMFDPLDVGSIRDALMSFFGLTQKEKIDMAHQSRRRAVEILNKGTFIIKYLNIIEK